MKRKQGDGGIGLMGPIKVEAYSGYKSDQRPLRFSLGDKTLEVDQVEDQWYGVSSMHFRVRAKDGNCYVLRHDEENDVWTLDAFRAGP
jgi:hypothetical protein